MAAIEEIEKQFSAIAREYDSGRRKFIPCFEDFYKNTTDFIVSAMNTPGGILDLGAGTGLLTMYYYQHFPHSKYLLVDIAKPMLAVAEERFRGIANIAYSCADYSQTLPDGPFDLIVSGLSIHHLENDRKRSLFNNIRQKLTAGGVFVNYDQFCADTPEISEKFDRYWIKQLHQSGLSDEELSQWNERRKLDRECSLNDAITMLKNCKFSNVDCVYSCQKFSVVLAGR